MERERKQVQVDDGLMRPGLGAEIADENLRTWQAQLVSGMLRVAAVVGFLAVVAGSFDALERENPWVLFIYWGTYAALLVFWLWPKAPYTLQVWGLIGLLWMMGVVTLIQVGRSGAGRVFMLTVPVIASLFLGRRESVWTVLLSVGTMVLFGVLFATEVLVVPGNSDAGNVVGWFAATAANLMLSLLIVVPLNYLVPRMSTALIRSQKMAQELADQRGSLEQLIGERTRDLARQSAQLEVSTRIARDAAMSQDVDQLLNNIVRFVADRFGFYHTGVFLIDKGAGYAMLRAASSEGGQRMLARGHRLRVGESNLVGYVIEQGKPRVALDVRADSTFADDPDLSETRSEMALPLQVRGEVIGALDVQSIEPGAFTQKDVAVLQALADQVAVAVDNVRLLTEARTALASTRFAYGELSREAWQELLKVRPDLAFASDGSGVAPFEVWEPQMVRAAQTGQVAGGDGDAANILAVPIRVREQVVGVLDGRKPDGTMWSADEIELLQALSDQLSTALESARLYEATQRRAAREQLTREISDRMRASLNWDELMQTALEEMAAALGSSRAFVQWVTPAEQAVEKRTRDA